MLRWLTVLVACPVLLTGEFAHGTSGDPPTSQPTGWHGSVPRPVASTQSATGLSTGPCHPTILPPGQTQADLRSFLLRHEPHFVTPRDPQHWRARADRLRQRVLDEVMLRGVPGTWLADPVNVAWGESLPGKGYTIRKLRYEALPGLWVGGLLYEPAGLSGKRPAVLNVNGHVGAPGMTIEYKQVRCINLVKRGMIALSLEWIGMGQLSGPGYAHNDQACLDLCGRAGVSVFYLSLKRGLDLLCSHPAADPDRIAVTGLSGGGWQTITISSLDTRVKLAAPNAGYIGIEERVWDAGDIGDLEQNPPDLVAIADYVDLTAMLFPRPALLIYNIKDDCCFKAERAKASVYRTVAPLYALAGLSDRFAFHVNLEPGTHNYLQDNREAFYRFLNQHFVPEAQRQDTEIPVSDEVRTQQELAIAYPPRNASFHTLAAEAGRSLPASSRPEGDVPALGGWRNRTRERLQEVVRPEPPLAADEPQSGMAGRFDAAEPTSGTAYPLALGGQWVLPIIEYAGQGPESAGVMLILADGGASSVRDLAGQAVRRASRVISVDLLFTGECMPAGDRSWQWAAMTATVGRRPLGIQVAQLDAVVDWVIRKHPGLPVHVVTKGRVAGLAALVASALNPGRFETVQLIDMERTLKDLLTGKVTYNQAPSMFCFGLLHVADVAELIDLALPTQVTLNRVENTTAVSQ